MIVYRLCPTLYANELNGEGARLYGGRWNNKGTPCLYTAASRALAVLEYSVNVNPFTIPIVLSMVGIEIPDDNHLTLSIAQLPDNWQTVPAPGDTKDFGTKLLTAAATAVIRIPSTVIKEEYNFLLNPLHQEHKLWRILDISDFVCDVRIKGF